MLQRAASDQRRSFHRRRLRQRGAHDRREDGRARYVSRVERRRERCNEAEIERPFEYDVHIRRNLAVVVLFAEKSTTLRVLEAARRVGVGSRFVWLGSDSWPDNRDVETRETAVLEGALAVQPLYAPLSGFDEYFTGLTLDHERSNPWFREFWRTYHNCTDDELEATTIAATSGGVSLCIDQVNETEVN